MSNNPRILLPKGISPSHYSLHIRPNMVDFTFLGTALIKLNVTESLSRIVLHSSELQFDSIILTQNNKATNVATDSVSFQKNDETATIPVAVTEGEADLEIEYRGEINDQMTGFYRSTFKDENEVSQPVGCTQFEPTDARKAFPCWDEPNHKATFDIKITAPENYLVLSNTPVESQKSKSGLNIFTFARTPKMSTYLLAWFIGKYKGKTVKTKNDVTVSIYTPPEKLDQAEIALSVAEKTLTFFEDYFQIKYPLAKLDMVAISDFVNGAMENWGLITYRDSAIFTNEKSSAHSREWVKSVVAHELAHQWFGNLVTMEWWSQLWLNEGFATFMQTLANDRIYPEIGVWLSFLQDKLDIALHLDSMETSHPVEVEIQHSKEINEVFDVISYKKGASLLRMLYEYVGDESFRTGLSKYLNHFKYSNTDSDGLWKFLAESSGKDVTGFMHGFTRKQGYPLITVRQIASDGNTHTFRLEQSRFLLNGKAEEGEKTVWNIPIKVDVSGEKKWILMESQVLEVDFNIEKYDYIRFNSGSTGFFRTFHVGELAEKMNKAVAENMIDESDRFMVVSDTKALFVASKVSASYLLDLLSNYEREGQLIVWDALTNAIGTIYGIVCESPAEKSLDRFVLKLTTRIWKEMGEDRTESKQQKLHALVVALRARSGDEETIGMLKAKLKDLREGREVDGNLVSSAMRFSVRYGGEEEFEAVKHLAKTAEKPSEKNSALGALGMSRDEVTLGNALAFAMSSEVRRQDSSFVFSSVASNPKGTKVAWKYFKEHYATLRAEFTHNSLFSRFVSVVSHLDEKEQVDEAEAFFKEKDTKGYEKTLAQGLEQARLRIGLRQRELENVKKWLKTKGY